MRRLFTLATAALGAAAVALSALPSRAAVITFDFTASGGSVTGSGYNTVRSYSSGGVTLTARGFSTAGSSNASTFSTAQVGFYSGAGLGVCNQTEGTGCRSPNHQIDNNGRYDFVLFQMNPAIEIASVLVRTYSGADTDVSYFIGNAANPLNLSGSSYGALAGLGFGSEQTDSSSSSTNTVTVDPSGNATFNSLLFGARLGQSNDAFKIRSLTVTYNPTNPNDPPTPVPEPLALTLFGTGLLGLGVVARRRRRS